ncbi:MAG: hypothetical protein KAJ95_00455 [Gammaproteobacteria bacterium]|nr:hypothetical protein [Gammaproteobacteria bacterium]
MKYLLSIIAVFSLIQPAFAVDSTTPDSDTGMNLTGIWLVSPAGKASISSFVIGELTIVQTDDEIEGSYKLKNQDKTSVCSSSNYEVTGTVIGNEVTLTAVGSKSKLNGSATGDSFTLEGTGMEFFEGTICSGYVKSALVMNKI